MNKLDAQKLAIQKMREHGLENWILRFDRAKTRTGICRYSDSSISLSEPFVLVNDEAEVLDTILHEIAHALVGPGHHHDVTWRIRARSVGARPMSCASGSAKHPAMRYLGVCADCNIQVHRERLSPRLRDSARHTPCKWRTNGGKVVWQENKA